MAKSQLPSSGTIRQLLTYDPLTGRLFWRKRPVAMFDDTPSRSAAHAAANWNSRYAGTEAATSLNDQGYRQAQIFGIRTRAHILAWAIHYGEVPEADIDHVNGDRSDNRITNLRLATRSQNQCNRRSDTRGCVSFRGVSRSANGHRFIAYIKVERISRYLGTFNTPEEAAQAYDAAALQLHGEFAVLNSPGP